MKVIICPGVHEIQLTNHFLNSLLNNQEERIVNDKITDFLIFPTSKYPAYSAFHIYDWLNKPEILKEQLLFISFSAGVVGSIGAATALQLQGVTIKAFIAIDGWGVPLLANFPIYRLSHDYFTHWSSAFLDTGKESFYSDPPVEHLTLWSSPENCQGWIVKEGTQQETNKVKSSVRDYLLHIINKD